MKIADIEIGSDYAIATGWSTKAEWGRTNVRATVQRLTDEVVQKGITRSDGTVVRPPKTEKRIVVVETAGGKERTIKGISILCPWEEYAAYDAAEKAKKQAENDLSDRVKSYLTGKGVERAYVDVRHARTNPTSDDFVLRVNITFNGDQAEKLIGKQS